VLDICTHICVRYMYVCMYIYVCACTMRDKSCNIISRFWGEGGMSADYD
jgi:hypothetical protein